MTDSANIRMLKEVAHSLGNVAEEFVFVGGAVVELYATDPAPPPVRPTADVDCVVEVTSRQAYRDVEKDLGKTRFHA